MGVLIDKFFRKIKSHHRKVCFKHYTKTKHNDFKIVGDVFLFNKNIIIGKNVTIYPNVTFWGDGVITIGDNVSIGQGTIIFASAKCGGISIGSNTQIAAYCYIIDMDHGIESGIPIIEQRNSYSKINIGNDVWLGAGSKILRGSLIEDGAVIGAQSLVKGKIEKNGIAVGIPAKIIKYRWFLLIINLN